jgi:hypothetical protein
MNKTSTLFLLLILLLNPSKITAGDFSFGLTSQGQNFWFAIPQLPVTLINKALGGGASGFTYEWVSVKDSQGRIHIDNGNYFGFKAKDLFNNFGYDITFGYQPRFSIFGVFVNGGYKFRQFRMQADRTIEYHEKYKLNTVTAGVTLRITPLIRMYRHRNWSPIIELGTKYNKVFSCKAPYDNDTEQFGNGLSTNIAAGVRFKTSSIAVAYEMAHYDYFNKEYTSQDGSQPYTDIKSSNQSVTLKMQLDF